MDEYMRDILEDALHLSYDEGQISQVDYSNALAWVQENSEDAPQVTYEIYERGRLKASPETR